MQFIVPQFIDMEPKIIGPLSLRQFFTLVIGGMVVAVERRYSDLAMFIVLVIPTAAIFVTFTFANINGVPFHYFLLNFIGALSRPFLRIWSKNYKIKSRVAKTEIKTEDKLPQSPPKMISHQKLSELALIVDTGGAFHQEDFAEKLPAETAPAPVIPAQAGISSTSIA